VKLISHSNLFYWWPVWFLAFLMALWTYVENHRLAIVPAGTTATREADGSIVLRPPGDKRTDSLDAAVRNTGTSEPSFRARISQDSWLGAVFVIGLILTIVITNVPLRGLWSFMVIILVVVLALFISLFQGWDEIFDRLANLHIHINMAGYLFIGVCVFVVWAAATFVFDRRSYIVFTPGQIRYCEHIGAAVQIFPAMGAALEKQRDDLFRHYILGFGSGDLIVRTSDRHEIKLPNVLGIGWRLRTVEDMLRQVATVKE
jgi:hypothetical protein